MWGGTGGGGGEGEQDGEVRHEERGLFKGAVKCREGGKAEEEDRHGERNASQNQVQHAH